MSRGTTEVIRRMEVLDRELPPDDGVGHFNRMYLGVTRTLAAELAAGRFRDRVFADRLTVTFARLYLAAVDLWSTDRARAPRAWAPLFERRADRRIEPVQFALAGMNAHINRDLAVAVVETCKFLGTVPSRGSHRRDFDEVNEVLAEAEHEVRHQFLADHGLDDDEVLHAVERVFATFSITAARDGAWTNAEALWALRGLRPLSAQYLAALDRLVGFAGRGLLVPVRVAPGRP